MGLVGKRLPINRCGRWEQSNGLNNAQSFRTIVRWMQRTERGPGRSCLTENTIGCLCMGGKMPLVVAVAVAGAGAVAVAGAGNCEIKQPTMHCEA